MAILIQVISDVYTKYLPGNTLGDEFNRSSIDFNMDFRLEWIRMNILS